MPKGEFMHECDQCGRRLVEGVETDHGVFCDAACAGVYAHARRLGLKERSSKARTSVSKSEDEGSSPSAPAIPGEAYEHRAVEFLITDLHADVEDPDFPKWKAKLQELFERYERLTHYMKRPLGSDLLEDGTKVIDEILEMVERKIVAAEEFFGLTS